MYWGVRGSVRAPKEDSVAWSGEAMVLLAMDFWLTSHLLGQWGQLLRWWCGPLLMIGSGAFTVNPEAASICGSSSPSLPVMAAGRNQPQLSHFIIAPFLHQLCAHGSPVPPPCLGLPSHTVTLADWRAWLAPTSTAIPCSPQLAPGRCLVSVDEIQPGSIVSHPEISPQQIRYGQGTFGRGHHPRPPLWLWPCGNSNYSSSQATLRATIA